jgi:hypothetical protein
MIAGRVTSGAKRLLPRSVKRRVRRLAELIQFRLALRRFMRTSPNDPVSLEMLRNLIVGWGNVSWSAAVEYLAASLEALRNTDGAVLECGSGLTTLLVGIRCQQMGRRLWSLEHDEKWATLIRTILARHRVGAATVCHAPLIDRGCFAWYDIATLPPAERFSLVICDGPPASTKGGRYGLLPVIRERMNRSTTVLLDDTERASELEVLERWKESFGATVRLVRCAKPFAVAGFQSSESSVEGSRR